MENYNLQLIDSTYTIKEAKVVLLSLINDKINFLNQQIFSLKERYGVDTSHSENRVIALRREKKLLLDKFNALANDDALVDIKCQVTLKPSKAMGSKSFVLKEEL